MTRLLTTECPRCRVKTLDVIIGRKSTARAVTCGLCHTVYDYSAWTVKQDAEKVIDQIDLFHRDYKES